MLSVYWSFMLLDKNVRGRLEWAMESSAGMVLIVPLLFPIGSPEGCEEE